MIYGQFAHKPQECCHAFMLHCHVLDVQSRAHLSPPTQIVTSTITFVESHRSAMTSSLWPIMLSQRDTILVSIFCVSFKRKAENKSIDDFDGILLLIE